MRPSILLLLGACTTSALESNPADLQTVVTISNVIPWTSSQAGGDKTSAVGPGGSFDISFNAGRGDRLTFASMLGESNDWFFAPSERGIPLYDERGPISGDITSEIHLWDTGTEPVEELGIGPDTGNNQSSPSQGTLSTYVSLTQVMDGGTGFDQTNGAPFVIPKVSDMLRATLISLGDGQFNLHIENVSTTSTLETRVGTQAIHLSPPAWAVYPNYQLTPLLARPDNSRDIGLIALAESGDNSQLVASLQNAVGEATPIGNVAYVIHRDGEPLFTIGQPDRGLGLEQLAEDGNTAKILTSLASSTAYQAGGLAAAFNDPYVQAPLYPGQEYELLVDVHPGDRFSFATMFSTSNDWFFATQSDGVPFFNDDGSRVTGPIPVQLLDLGTEVDEPLRYGPDTAPMQSGAGQGSHDPDPLVRGVDAPYQDLVPQYIQVTFREGFTN
ncbi:MAG: spondin domain-containing protein [Kofleriaceae bacterium]